MNILTLGVKIDPSGAESGKRAVLAHSKEIAEALKKIKDAAGSASDALGKTTDRGAFGKITSAAQAATRAVTGAFAAMVRGVGASVAGITDALGKIGLAIDGVRMLTAPVRGFLADVIGNAADMESFRSQWAYILGSFDKAREKMASLQKFANATPFDLPGVTKAALMMADLTHEALKGEEGLKRVGDAAARAQQPIEELASRIVRLSGNLERGAGGGDELRALTEWRIFRPKAAAQISDLSTDPKNFAEAMKIVVAELDRSNNAMKLMSVSWKGLTSTFSDSWNSMKTAIGEPLIEGLKPFVVDMTAQVDKMTAQIKTWAPEIKNVGSGIAAAFKVLTEDGGIALTLGAAADYMIEQLKRGFIILGKMLMNVFDVITYKFTKALERLASKEFWIGVGEALVEGVAKAFKFMADWAAAQATSVAQTAGGAVRDAGILLDDISQGLGFHRIFNTDSSNFGKAVGHENDNVATPDVIDLTKPGAPDPGPQFLSPAEIEATVPYNETDRMRAYKARYGQAWDDTMTAQQYLEQQAADVINQSGLGAGPPESLLFPNQMSGPTGVGANLGEHLKELQSLSEEAQKLGEALRTPDEILADTLAKLEKMKDLPPGQGLTNEEYVRAVTKAYDDYSAAVEKGAKIEEKAVQATLREHDKLLASWADLHDQVDKAMVGISNSITSNVAGAFTDLITGAKSAKQAFADMASSIVRDIINMTMKIIVQYAYMKLLGWVTGTPTATFGAFANGMLSGVHHDGGVAGAPSTTRAVDPAIFNGAARFHSGGNVGRGEVPAILEQGETVLTRDQTEGIRRRLSQKPAGDAAGTAVTIINLTDPNAAQAEFARNPDAILNVIAPQLPKVRDMVVQKGTRR